MKDHLRAASQERPPCRGSCSDLSEEHYHPSQERPQPDIGEAQASEFQVGYEAGVRATRTQRPTIDVERLLWDIAARIRSDAYLTYHAGPENLVRDALDAEYARLSGSVGE